jgi:hypothetical protein
LSAGKPCAGIIIDNNNAWTHNNSLLDNISTFALIAYKIKIIICYFCKRHVENIKH